MYEGASKIKLKNVNKRRMLILLLSLQNSEGGGNVNSGDN
jgi:hypothetical protein